MSSMVAIAPKGIRCKDDGRKPLGELVPVYLHDFRLNCHRRERQLLDSYHLVQCPFNITVYLSTLKVK